MFRPHRCNFLSNFDLCESTSFTVGGYAVERFVLCGGVFPILKLDDADIDPNELPGGAIGAAAIYTESVKVTHLLRRVELRMKSWLNYISP